MQAGWQITLMKINLFKFFKKKKSIQDDFPMSSFRSLEIEGQSYPLFISLESKGLLAYSTRFMIKPEDLPLVEKLVEQHFHKVSVEKKEHLHNYDKSLCYYRFNDLNHIAIDLITNDNDFIINLNDLKLVPPSPDAVFPHLDLDCYGSLQGELEFWWNIYWEPYWKSMTEKSRNEYIKSNNLRTGTVLFLEDS